MGAWTKSSRFSFGRLLGKLLHLVYRARWDFLKPARSAGPGLSAILSVLRGAGVRPGATLMLHSSWDRLKEGGFSAAELVEELLAFLGPEGTLAMPAFPDQNFDHQQVFDVERTVSRAGWVTEVFRRRSGVIRSISLNHSVCALGPSAEYLTSEHHLGLTSWDSFSPFFRLRNIENAWVVGLGVGFRLGVATSLHAVESTLAEHRYYRKLFGQEIHYDYASARLGLGRGRFLPRMGAIYPPKIAKYFARDELMEYSLDGLSIYAIPAKTLIDKAIRMGKQGKSMYCWPIPWPWLFNPRQSGAGCVGLYRHLYAWSTRIHRTRCGSAVDEKSRKSVSPSHVVGNESL